MKKKMTAFIALVMAVVLTASSVSGTYAKYTTSAESADEARVAKWAIGTTNEVNLFSDSYIAAADGLSEAGNTTGQTTVVSTDGKKVVAPGTKGSYEFTINTTNVNETNFTLDVEVVDGTDKSYDNIGLVYTLDGNKVGTNGTFAELKEALSKLYKEADGTNTVYAHNAATTDLKHTIGWSWAFDGVDADDTAKGTKYTTHVTPGDDTSAMNEQDTVKLTIKVTATQSNKAAN